MSTRAGDRCSPEVVVAAGTTTGASTSTSSSSPPTDGSSSVTATTTSPQQPQGASAQQPGGGGGDATTTKSSLINKVRGLDKVTKYVREQRVGPLLNGMLLYVTHEKPEDPLEALLNYLEDVQEAQALREEERRVARLNRAGYDPDEESFHIEGEESYMRGSDASSIHASAGGRSRTDTSDAPHNYSSDDFVLADTPMGSPLVSMKPPSTPQRGPPVDSKFTVVPPNSENRETESGQVGDIRGEANGLLRQIADNEKAFLALLEQSQAEVSQTSLPSATTSPPSSSSGGGKEEDRRGTSSREGSLQPSPPRTEKNTSEGSRRIAGPTAPGWSGKGDPEDTHQSLKSLLSTLQGESKDLLSAVLQSLGEDES